MITKFVKKKKHNVMKTNNCMWMGSHDPFLLSLSL